MPMMPLLVNVPHPQSGGGTLIDKWALYLSKLFDSCKYQRILPTDLHGEGVAVDCKRNCNVIRKAQHRGRGDNDTAVGDELVADLDRGTGKGRRHRRRWEQ